MLAPRSSPTTTLVPPTSADLPTRVVVAFLAGLISRLALRQHPGSSVESLGIVSDLTAKALRPYQAVLDFSIDGWPADIGPDRLLGRVLEGGAALLTGPDARRILENDRLPTNRPPVGAPVSDLLARLREDHPVPAALVAAALAERLAPVECAVPLLSTAAAPALDALRESLWRSGLHSWDTALFFGAQTYPASVRLSEADELLKRVRAASQAVVEIRFPGTAERERRALRRQRRRREHSAERRLEEALAISATPARGRHVGRTSALLCENWLTLRGPVDARAAFVGAVAGTPPNEVRRPAAGWSAGCPSHPLSLQKGLPMPYEVLMKSALEREAWALEHWGSPWDVEGPFQFLHRTDEYVFAFRTLCVPPLEWFDELTDRHPLLSFTLESDMRAFDEVVTHKWRDGLRQTRCHDVEDFYWTPALTTACAQTGVTGVIGVVQSS